MLVVVAAVIAAVGPTGNFILLSVVSLASADVTLAEVERTRYVKTCA